MKLVLLVRKSGVFEGDSYIELILHTSLHEDMKLQIACPVCDKKCFALLASVDSLEIKETSRLFKDIEEEEQILTKIKFRIEQILRNLPTCVARNEPDEEHKGYIKNLFAFHSNYVLKEYHFE